MPVAVVHAFILSPRESAMGTEPTIRERHVGRHVFHIDKSYHLVTASDDGKDCIQRVGMRSLIDLMKSGNVSRHGSLMEKARLSQNRKMRQPHLIFLGIFTGKHLFECLLLGAKGTEQASRRLSNRQLQSQQFPLYPSSSNV